MITLYGSRRSRATRCLWALEELGLDYTHQPMDEPGATKTDAYRALNPAGKVPTMVDGEIAIFESIAINLYLSLTYGQGRLWPNDRRAQALALQWSLWAVTEAEPSLVVMLVERVFKAEGSRDVEKLAMAEKEFAPRLDVLASSLGRSEPFLSGVGFTVADLNVASVLRMVRLTGFDLGPWPKVNSWLEAALARPAFQKAMGR